MGDDDDDGSLRPGREEERQPAPWAYGIAFFTSCPVAGRARRCWWLAPRQAKPSSFSMPPVARDDVFLLLPRRRLYAPTLNHRSKRSFDRQEK